MSLVNPMKLASSDTVSERLSHCNGCEHNKLGICKRCGCIVNGKARLAGSWCPIGLWGKEEFVIKPEKMGLGSFFRH